VYLPNLAEHLAQRRALPRRFAGISSSGFATAEQSWALWKTTFMRVGRSTVGTGSNHPNGAAWDGGVTPRRVPQGRQTETTPSRRAVERRRQARAVAGGHVAAIELWSWMSWLRPLAFAS
jgi:hypothetical protein